MSKSQDEVITFKASSEFKGHLNKLAIKKETKVGTLIKAILYKYTKFKEKQNELV